MTSRRSAAYSVLVVVCSITAMLPYTSSSSDSSRSAAHEASKWHNPDAAPISEYPHIAIAVRSQDGRLHRERLDILRRALDVVEREPNNVFEMHTTFGSNSWALLSIMSNVRGKIDDRVQWVLFVDDDVSVHLDNLSKALKPYDPAQPHMIGKALTDSEWTIIHHYHDDFTFEYPDLACGLALSVPLIELFASAMQDQKIQVDFTIDVQHELAMAASKHFGVTMVDMEDVFCQAAKPGCAIVAHGAPPVQPFEQDLRISDIAIGVKTTEKYHQTRLQHLISSWGHKAEHIVYYSEKEDKNIPTTATGVPNTETGHCAKLERIISDIPARFPDAKWYVVVDDDTALSLDRLRDMLSLYDPQEPILIGERYAYGMRDSSAGYSYPTGGSGMVMSKSAIQKLLGKHCWKPDSPDDMWLGATCRQTGIPIVHNSGLHQAAPQAYNKSMLAHQTLISFHKCIQEGDCDHPGFEL